MYHVFLCRCLTSGGQSYIMNIVQNEVKRMNKVVTSQEAILNTCRELVVKEGLAAINMRTVAQACGVAVGSLYNYFPSKGALMQATIRSVWMDIFSVQERNHQCSGFLEYLEWMFGCMQWGHTKYPGFLSLHAMSFTEASRADGRREMEEYFGHLKGSLLCVLEQDRNVRTDAFGESLSKEALVDLAFSTMIWMFVQDKVSCEPFFEMVRRSIY